MELRSLAESWQCDRYCLVGSTTPLRPYPSAAEAPVGRTMRFSRKHHFVREASLELCPLVELRLLQSMTGPCRRPWPGLATSPAAAPLMGFLSPTTHQARRSHHPGAFHTPFVALTGFLTLSAPCSPPNRPTLFHAGNVHGVSPSELCPLEEPYRLSAAVALLMLPVTLRTTRPDPATRNGPKPAARIQT